MSNCEKCGNDLVTSKVTDYRVTDFGTPVRLLNSVIQEHCATCGEDDYLIPDLPGLAAAIALKRITLPFKLTGAEIKFLRKVLNSQAKDLAEGLMVTPETISRWENDKVPMPPAIEKLFRLTMGARLKDRAPFVEFDQLKVSNMHILAVRDSSEQLELAFVRVRAMKMEDTYAEAA